MKKKTKRRHPHEPDLAKAAIEFYREQAYTQLAKHGGPPGAIDHAIIHLVSNGCPLRTASLLVEWEVTHSFGSVAVRWRAR